MKTNINKTRGWSDGSINKIQDVLADTTTIVKFEKVLEYQNTEIGNIYIDNPRNKEIQGCLSNYLVQKGCAILDENTFKLGNLS